MLTHYWRIRKRLPERFGQKCKMLARGTLNSCLIEFEDGCQVVTSRNFVRKIKLKEEVEMSFTHAELVERAGKWLRGSRRCFPVFLEHKCMGTSESPDAFGICSLGGIVVECKTSVSDFYKDLKKPFRVNPAEGMGQQRYYLTPRNLISSERLVLAPGWGLLEVRGERIKVIRESEVFTPSSNRESLLLRSAWILQRDMAAVKS